MRHIEDAPSAPRHQHEKPLLRIFFSVLLTGLAVLVGSCALMGGSGERIQHAKGYSITPPKSWKSHEPDEGDAAFRLPSGGMVTLVSSCGSNTKAPLEVLARQLLFGFHNQVVLTREKKKINDIEGLFTKAVGTLSDTKLHLELFTFAQNACVFDFSLINPKPIAALEEKEFFSYIESFRYGKD